MDQREEKEGDKCHFMKTGHIPGYVHPRILKQDNVVSWTIFTWGVCSETQRSNGLPSKSYLVDKRQSSYSQPGLTPAEAQPQKQRREVGAAHVISQLFHVMVRAL